MRRMSVHVATAARGTGGCGALEATIVAVAHGTAIEIMPTTPAAAAQTIVTQGVTHRAPHLQPLRLPRPQPSSVITLLRLVLTQHEMSYTYAGYSFGAFNAQLRPTTYYDLPLRTRTHYYTLLTATTHNNARLRPTTADTEAPLYLVHLRWTHMLGYSDYDYA